LRIKIYPLAQQVSPPAFNHVVSIIDRYRPFVKRQNAGFVQLISSRGPAFAWVVALRRRTGDTLQMVEKPVSVESIAEPERVQRGPDQPGSKRGRTAVRLHAVSADEGRGVATERAKKPAKAPRKRGEDVRRRILDAALECFGAFGFDGASTRAVAERAGVTHTLVLYHFDSKDALWLKMMEDALNAYRESISANLDTSDNRPASETLRIFIEQFVRLSARYPQIHRIMTMEGNQESARIHWVINNHLRDHYMRIRDLIKLGQTEGTVRECDAARLYYFIIGGGGTPYTLSIEYRALTGRDVFSEAEIYRNIAFLFEVVFVSDGARSADRS
jgi:TetR/AcrR family transcriptional regulator